MIDFIDPVYLVTVVAVVVSRLSGRQVGSEQAGDDMRSEP